MIDRDELITSNIPLIKKVIKDMHLFWETEDEYQEYFDNGLLGLIKGCERYDGSTKPSSFLYPCIKNEILHGLTIKTQKRHCNEAGKDMSLNVIVNEGDNKETEYGDFIPDPNVDIEKEIERKLESERLLNAVNSLENEKDKLVIKMYYGLDGYMPRTIGSIANEFKVSRQAVNVRLIRAKSKLKDYLERNNRDVFIKQKKKEKRMIVERNEEPKVDNPKNTLLGLNDILFNQLNKLNNAADDTEFEKEIRKSYAVSQLAQQIVANTNTCIKALKLAKEDNVDSKQLGFVGLNEK